MQAEIDLRSIYLANGVGIFIMLMLYYVSRTKILGRRVEDRIYSYTIFGVMFGCFFEAFSYFLDGKTFPGAIILNHIANTYLFTVNLILPLCVLVYVDLGLYGDPKRIWKHYKPQIFIGSAMLLLTLINLFVPIVYYISPGNVYERRPLGYAYYIVILYFLISAIVVTKRYEKEYGARAFFNINMFLIPILVGAGLQFAVYGLSLAWLSSAIGLTGLYMMQQNETAYIDSLLYTYNRRYLDFVLASWIDRGYSFSGLMLDIDSFKGINDSYGHSEGDKALMKAADILRRSRVSKENVFRFAGDEFIVLERMEPGRTLDEYTAEMERNLAEFNEGRGDDEYRLSFSYGVSSFEPGKGDIDSFMKDLDERMYEMKREHYRPGRFDRRRPVRDSLTGLHTREQLLGEIPALLAEHPDTPYQILFVDINEFKIVNDVFGRDFGDRVLKHIADWIRADATDRWAYGRLGGDTFGVCLPVDEFDPDEINEKLSRLVISKDGKEHHPLVHVGVYRIEDPGTDVSIMFDRARMALTKIKRIYSHIAYYNEAIRDEMLWNQQISAQIGSAIKDGQIRPYLQPIVNAEGDLAGAEALVRWIHPEKGFIEPARFIPEFEHNGRIAEVDRHMWLSAGRLLSAWKRTHPDLFISVNISPVDFFFLDLPAELNAIVKECGIEPSKLRLEITEAIMMRNVGERLEVISQLREDGFIVEIDDFGAGYSSLNMLKDMPVDLIKLDMAFLRDSKGNDRAEKIVGSVIRLIDSLGMDSLTEGVENEEQFRMLAGFGCKLFQGYYFAKPMPVEEFEVFCKAEKKR